MTQDESHQWLNNVIAVGKGSIDVARSALSMRNYECRVDYRPCRAHQACKRLSHARGHFSRPGPGQCSWPSASRASPGRPAYLARPPVRW
jgi:hypothetical protein